MNIQFTADGTQPIEFPILKHCTNLIRLQIAFHRIASLEELMFLQKLPKLKELQLSAPGQIALAAAENVGLCTLDIFRTLNTSLLQNLEIMWDLFGTITTKQMATTFNFINFPNLKEINLKYLRNIPCNIFAQLSKIKTLKQIEIIGIEGTTCLTNEMFTQLCESQQQQGENNLVPAITAFKKLTLLTINNCQDLTDTFIVESLYQRLC